MAFEYIDAGCDQVLGALRFGQLLLDGWEALAQIDIWNLCVLPI